MTNHPIISAAHRTASSDIDDARRSAPFRADLLCAEMSTYAALALDIIEKQTGFKADLDRMLSALEAHAEGRLRWVRISGHREEFVVFRDLSMITYREPMASAGIEDLDEDELLARQVIEECALGRSRDFSEDEMLDGLLPVAFTLDLGCNPHASSGVVLKPRVDKHKTGGESLMFLCRGERLEAVITSPTDITALTGALRHALDQVEENIEHARAAALDLPALRRPEGSQMHGVDIEEFEMSGLWQLNGTAYYWPPYLSRPASVEEDTADACTVLSELGELALWACPKTADKVVLTLMTAMTTEGSPSVAFDIPSHIRGDDRSELRAALMRLQADFNEILLLVGYHLPVGHLTGIKTATSAGAAPIAAASVEVTRPDARRAVELDQERMHSFDELPGYIDPQKALEREEALQAPPRPGAFDMAEQDGVVFTCETEGQSFHPVDNPRAFKVAIGGGQQAELMQRLVARSVGGDQMDDYEAVPDCDDNSFGYSIVAGDADDPHLRRPFGYATISGLLWAKPEDQLGGEVQGRPVTTYSLGLHLDRIAVADRCGDAERNVLLSAITHAMTNLVVATYAKGQAQGRHFEIDVEMSRSTENWHDTPVTAEDVGFIQEALINLRRLMVQWDVSEFVSLRDIHYVSEDYLAA